jgi:hypothetical protein
VVEITKSHEFAQMLELSQVNTNQSFQETLRVLGQLTSLHLSDVLREGGMNVLPEKDIGSLTNLRYITHKHTYYILHNLGLQAPIGQRCLRLRSYSTDKNSIYIIHPYKRSPYKGRLQLSDILGRRRPVGFVREPYPIRVGTL